MFQSIRQIAERISSLIAEKPFSCGFLTGLAVAFALLLFFLLLSLILHSRRKLRRIVIPSEGGDLKIDAKAVQGAVRSVAESFPEFDIRRVRLYGKQDEAELDVAMDFIGANANESVSDLSAQFRAAVVRMMTRTFGMEKPARIEIEILRSGAEIPVDETKPPAAGPETPAAGPETPAAGTALPAAATETSPGEVSTDQDTPAAEKTDDPASGQPC